MQSHDIWNNRFISRIIDSMADGVFTMDNQGRIVSWNRSMERISGFRADEALGQHCDLLRCSRCFGKNCPADIKKCHILEYNTSEAKECQLRHKDGYDVPIIKNASVVRDDNGDVLGIVETVTDLTELNLARRRAEEANLRLGEIHNFSNIIGKSEAIVSVFRSIKAAAASDATVAIQGESGTGKELVAGAIHFHSQRKNNPLVTVSCSALSEPLLESELFGHIKGAYTGALRDRVGRFEEAEGGTIFLDEIGELSPVIQVKLLRVLQEREIERVGDSQKRKIDIRIVTATHQDLHKKVKNGTFREDLYYRLKVFPISLPPLRDRKEDIPLLTAHFIKSFNIATNKTVVDTSTQVMRRFMDYHWPGNVRELENAIEHAFVLCAGDRIELDDIPLEIRKSTSSALLESPAIIHNLRRQPEKDELLTLLTDCNWNKAEVARRTGYSRTAIWKHMKKYGIPLHKPETPSSAK